MSESEELDKNPDPSKTMVGPDAKTILGTTFGNSETDDMFGKSRKNWGDNFLPSSFSGSNNNNNNNAIPLPSEIDNPEEVTMGQETSISFKRLFQSQYNLALIFGSVGVETIINHIAKVVLNTEDLDSIDEDEAINNLKKKLDKLASITKNPKTREAFGKASKAIGDIFLIFVEHANEPMMKVGERATKISFHILTIMFNQAIQTLEDSLMLIPIFGNGYMILQNVADMAGSATTIGQGTMRYYSDIAQAYSEISDSVSGDESLDESKTTLKESLKDIWESFKEAVNETTELNEKYIAEYADTPEDKNTQKLLAKEREAAENSKESSPQASAPPLPVTSEPVTALPVAEVEGNESKKGGSIKNKTYKNKVGGSNNLTRKRRF